MCCSLLLSDGMSYSPNEELTVSSALQGPAVCKLQQVLEASLRAPRKRRRGVIEWTKKSENQNEEGVGGGAA